MALQLVGLDGVQNIGNIGDITTPTSTQLYPLGYTRTFWDKSTSASKITYQYVQAAATLTQYGVYVLTYSSTAGSEFTTGTPASLAVYQQVVVPQVAFTSGYYGWVAVEGYAKVNPTSTPTAGHFGKVVNAAITATDEATISTASICIFLSAAASATPCILLGNNVIIA